MALAPQLGTSIKCHANRIMPGNWNTCLTGIVTLGTGKDVTIEQLLPLYLQLLRDESSEVRFLSRCPTDAFNPTHMFFNTCRFLANSCLSR
jgi:hypothetical protein|eukprot:COSAG06_NODE_2817_length_6234_cov_9.629177_6_plen_91_part_00